MRKILVLTSHHPSRRQPARAIYGYYTYRALARYCAVRVLSPWPWWSRLRWPGDLVRTPRERWGELDVEYPPFWSLPGVPAAHAAGMAASLARRVAGLRREFPFEAILTAWAYPDAVAAAALARRARVPLVATVLGSDLNELPRRRLLRPQIAWGLGRARRVIAVSRPLAERAVALGIPRERAVVCHNGVDGEVFALRDRREARAALGLDPARPLVGYVGNLAREKGPDVLLEAVPALLRRAGPVDVALIGAGGEEPALRARAAALGLGDRVRFLGRKVHDEVPTWIAAFDVLCLPSRREGCPNVVLEALATGRPVVAAAVGGVPDLLDRDNGLLVPPERPDALAEALAAALARPWDPAALRATVPSPSWDAVARTYRDVLEAAIAEGPERP